MRSLDVLAMVYVVVVVVSVWDVRLRVGAGGAVGARGRPGGQSRHVELLLTLHLVVHLLARAVVVVIMLRLVLVVILLLVVVLLVIVVTHVIIVIPQPLLLLLVEALVVSVSVLVVDRHPLAAPLLLRHGEGR